MICLIKIVAILCAHVHETVSKCHFRYNSLSSLQILTMHYANFVLENKWIYVMNQMVQLYEIIYFY